MNKLPEFHVFENEITQMNKEWIDISLKNGMTKEDLIKYVEYVLSEKPNDANFKRILTFLTKDK